MSDTIVGDDGDDTRDEETFGIDNVLLVLLVAVLASVVEYVVAAVDDDVDGPGRK